MATAARRGAVAGATLAAVLLAGGCVVGPTIEDERPASDARTPVGRSQTTGGMGAEPPRGDLPTGGTVPGGTAPGPAVTGPVRLTIGGEGAYETDGSHLRVLEVVEEGPSTTRGLVIAGVRIAIQAGSTGFKPSGLDVNLRACPAFAGSKCEKPGSTAGGRPYQNPGNIAPGTSTTLVWYFEAPSAALTRGTVTVSSFVPGDPGAEFSPAPATSAATPSTPASSASVSAGGR
jgi:hypothetical protein